MDVVITDLVKNMIKSLEIYMCLAVVTHCYGFDTNCAISKEGASDDKLFFVVSSLFAFFTL